MCNQCDEVLLIYCREGLNSLVALGFHFQALQDYVEGTTSLLPGQQKSSLIRRAVATGLSGGTFAQQQLLDVKCLSVFMDTWRPDF